MAEHQQTSLRELFLERTFGSGDSQHIKVTIENQVLFDSDLRSARAIRLLRFRRFCWATAFGYTLVHTITLALGSDMLGANLHWYDWASMFGLLAMGLPFSWLANHLLKVEAGTRRQLEKQAFFMDDLAEEFAANMTPEEQAELRKAAVDYLSASQDPTLFDRPWWRLRDPLKNRAA